MVPAPQVMVQAPQVTVLAPSSTMSAPSGTASTSFLHYLTSLETIRHHPHHPVPYSYGAAPQVMVQAPQVTVLAPSSTMSAPSGTASTSFLHYLTSLETIRHHPVPSGTI